MKFVQKVAGVVRSTRADYNLPNKTKTELYLRVFCQNSAEILRKYGPAIETLATCSKVVVTDSPPAGCAILTVSDKVSAHLNLKGLIDPSKEKEKLEKKKVALVAQIDKLKKLTEVKGNFFRFIRSGLAFPRPSERPSVRLPSELT